ncbi:Competence protein A [Photorhabdus australis subsp. thailandensis]|uniref:Competence protein A n=1 Tax=Photorhabdus australis subsp. thailandensis TaxID=2805096 RepID=A0A1C0U8N7_9GAMM|nr:pilus assembly protein PilM [Photorhabdus australis]OCQ54302.1 Competence protein A [Photorhabdus australis subsp. thailandensis]
MHSPKWYVGLDIQNGIVRAVAAIKRRDGWQLRHCWQYLLPDEVMPEGRLQRPEILRDILNQWRQKLPKKISFRLALPVQQTLQRNLVLPPDISLKEPEQSWFINASAEKQFPFNTRELTLDYRIIEQNAYISAARQKDLDLWLQCLAQAGIFPDAIDIAPCALRYMAQYSGVPINCWLLHRQQSGWLWVSPVNAPFAYDLVSANTAVSPQQVISQLPASSITEKHIYYSSFQQEALPEGTCSWDMLAAFRHYHPPLPIHLMEYVIAGGLALRPDDK